MASFSSSRLTAVHPFWSFATLYLLGTALSTLHYNRRLWHGLGLDPH